MNRPSAAQRDCLEIAANNKKNGYIVRLSGRYARTGVVLRRNGWVVLYDHCPSGGIVYEITNKGRAALDGET